MNASSGNPVIVVIFWSDSACDVAERRDRYITCCWVQPSIPRHWPCVRYMTSSRAVTPGDAKAADNTTAVSAFFCDTSARAQYHRLPRNEYSTGERLPLSHTFKIAKCRTLVCILCKVPCSLGHIQRSIRTVSLYRSSTVMEKLVSGEAR